MDFWQIIVNPTAGNGAAGRAWPKIEQLLQEFGFSYSVQFTESRGHAMRLADDALLKGRRNILGIGGDGTNSEICHGILANQWVDPREVKYALLPVGTGNDWARQWQIPADPRARLLRLLEPKTVFSDAGKAEFLGKDGQPGNRFFVNVAGMAYDGFIAQKLENQRIPHKFGYLALVAKYLFEYKLAPARVRFDEQTAEDFFYTINVGVCRYSAGGMLLVPQAVPDDGLFALTFARRLAKWQVLLLTKRFFDGSLVRHPKVTAMSARKISVEALDPAQPILLEADGEFLGTTPCAFSIVEKALQIVL